MLARTGALAAVLLMAPMSALALAPRGAAAVGDWTISPGAGASAPVRVAPRYDWNVPLRPAAWQRFTAALPGRWYASWDHATAMPTRIYGEGVRVPGSVADAAIAEEFARRLSAEGIAAVARHRDLGRE
jgi:hypothetical protein